VRDVLTKVSMPGERLLVAGTYVRLHIIVLGMFTSLT
jgi:hypothetical protein